MSQLFNKVGGNLKEVFFLTTLCIVIEWVQFGFLGLFYPYPADISVWLIRNLFYGSLLYLLWFKKRQPKASPPKKSAPILVSIFLTIAIQLAYPYTPLCGPRCIGLIIFAIPFFFVVCVAITTVFLFFCQNLQSSQINRWLLVGLICSIYLVVKPLQLDHLEKRYPITWRSSDYPLAQVKPLSKELSEKDWVSLCKQFGFLSLGSHVFGALHSSNCFRYGAALYKNEGLCDNLNEYLPPRGYYFTRPFELPDRKECLEHASRWKYRSEE